VDYLLSPEVEAMLARGSSAQFPVNPDVTARSRIEPAGPVRWMAADFGTAADRWEASAQFLQLHFATAE
jgi:ABC-type Fe3+ transport system substrate-binding protein